MKPPRDPRDAQPTDVLIGKITDDESSGLERSFSEIRSRPCWKSSKRENSMPWAMNSNSSFPTLVNRAEYSSIFFAERKR